MDQHGVLYDANQSFHLFAQDNEHPTYDPKQWIGKNLLDVIHGDRTRLLHDALILKARLHSTPVELSFRCDSPTSARYLRMVIVAQPNLHIHFRIHTDKEQAYPQPVFFEYEASASVPRCDVCNRMEVEGTWIDPLDMASVSKDPDLIWKVCHSLCSDCDQHFTHLVISES